MKLAFTILVGISLTTSLSIAASQSGEHPKWIIGRWLGPRKFHVFHADGSWGVERNENAPEDIGGRRWKIEGNKLILIYPTDNGVGTPVRMISATYVITSHTHQNLTTEIDGYKEEYKWSP
jgi:hypothetical protein